MEEARTPFCELRKSNLKYKETRSVVLRYDRPGFIIENFAVEYLRLILIHLRKVLDAFLSGLQL